jgi:hypothetical protein
MPVQKFFDLSTGHLTDQDRKLLEMYPAKDRPSGMALIAYPYEYGWTVSTSSVMEPETLEDHLDAIRAEGFSESFIKILMHAAGEKCWMVRFDSDAAHEPGFEVFEWESDAPAATPART